MMYCLVPFGHGDRGFDLHSGNECMLRVCCLCCRVQTDVCGDRPESLSEEVYVTSVNKAQKPENGKQWSTSAFGRQ
jgi:hypothetical protein